jgi:hypothetical protein
MSNKEFTFTFTSSLFVRTAARLIFPLSAVFAADEDNC